MSYLLLLLPPYINLNPLSGYPLHPGRHGDVSRYFYLISFTKHILCLPPSPLTGKLLALVLYLAAAVQCFALTPLSDKHPPPHPPALASVKREYFATDVSQAKTDKIPSQYCRSGTLSVGPIFHFSGFVFSFSGWTRKVYFHHTRLCAAALLPLFILCK